jgi:hypothetical protein
MAVVPGVQAFRVPVSLQDQPQGRNTLLGEILARHQGQDVTNNPVLLVKIYHITNVTWPVLTGKATSERSPAEA